MIHENTVRILNEGDSGRESPLAVLMGVGTFRLGASWFRTHHPRQTCGDDEKHSNPAVAHAHFPLAKTVADVMVPLASLR